MKYLPSLTIAVCCARLFTLVSTQALPALQIRDDDEDGPPAPTRSFTVSAFVSPLPLGQGITGLNLTARGGNFFLSPDPNGEVTLTEPNVGDPTVFGTDNEMRAVQKAVIFVAADGTAYLQNKKSKAIFIDTYDGHLSFTDPPPSGAIFVNFVHLGRGAQVYNQLPDGSVGQAPAIFQWIGSLVDEWFACPRGDAGEYQVFKQMTVYGPPDLSGCVAFGASAIDY